MYTRFGNKAGYLAFAFLDDLIIFELPNLWVWTFFTLCHEIDNERLAYILCYMDTQNITAKDWKKIHIIFRGGEHRDFFV